VGVHSPCSLVVSCSSHSGVGCVLKICVQEVCVPCSTGVQRPHCAELFSDVGQPMSQPLVRDLSPGVDDNIGRWIGEETRRGLPPYVYKYYLNRTRAFRRQSLKVRNAAERVYGLCYLLCSRCVVLECYRCWEKRLIIC
jgi:hypothetical protein